MDNTTCNICGNPLSQPKYRIVKGKRVEQCVARCHDLHTLSPTAAAFLADAKRAFRKAKAKRI